MILRFIGQSIRIVKVPLRILLLIIVFSEQQQRDV